MYYSYLAAYQALFETPSPITEGTQINFLCSQPAFRYLCSGNPCCNACIRRYCCSCSCSFN